MTKNQEAEMWKLVEAEIANGGCLSRQEMMLDIKTFLEAISDGNVTIAKFMATSLAIKFRKVAEDGGQLGR